LDKKNKVIIDVDREDEHIWSKHINILKIGLDWLGLKKPLKSPFESGKIE
jgi:hypothetical protein